MFRYVLTIILMGLSILMIIGALIYLKDYQVYQADGKVNLAGQSLVGMLVDLMLAVGSAIAARAAFLWSKDKTK